MMLKPSISCHWLIVGNIRAGKSVALRQHIVPAWAWPEKYGIRRPPKHVIVLDPIGQRWPGATFVTRDHLEWLEALQGSRGCVGVWDECGNDCESNPDIARQLLWAATLSGNNGHAVYFVGQRAFQIPPSIRNNCASAIVFHQRGLNDRKVLADVYGQEMMAANTLATHECIVARSMERTVKTRFPLVS